MHLLDGRPVYAASDLVGFLLCEHLTDLDRAALAGLVGRPHRDDAELDLIRKRGERHEQRFLAELRADGLEPVTIDPDAYADAPDGSRDGYGERLRRQVAETVAAMHRGEQVIYQAAFFDETWRGHADFLRRVDGDDAASALGSFHYEVIDTKLAHKAKASALIQLCSYVDLLERHQARRPEFMYVALGGLERPTERYRVADYFAYYRALKQRFMQTVADVAAGGRPVDYPPPLSQPEPVDHCAVCRWFLVCRDRWRQADHLSLVAGISRNQRRGLSERAVDTRRGLAALPLPVPRIERTSGEALTRVREQARIQVEGEDAGEMRYELIEPERLEDGSIVPSRGLAALPPPSPGDLFFDIEGDPFAFDVGLEYLFGVAEPRREDEHGRPTYHARWAVRPEDEKAAFEWFIDLVMDRRAADPGLHVYHYGSYERGRVARLSTRYATREEQVDVLLRSGTFVDLLGVVRQGVRASVEGYSIKNLEPLYGFEREVELRAANESIVEFEHYLEEGGTDESILQRIADYNRDDCLSAWRLRDWLEDRRPEAEHVFGVLLPRPAEQAGEPSPAKSAERLEVEQVALTLTAGLPAPEQRTPEQRGCQLLADLLDWHWREEKSMWWRFFDLMRRPEEELLEAREPLAGVEFVDEVPPGVRQKNARYRYRFPPQENDLRPGIAVHDPRLLDAEGGSAVGTVEEIDQVAGELVLSRKPGLTDQPTALVPLDRYSTDAQRARLLEIGRWVAANGIRAAGPYRAARDLLLRAGPRVGQRGAGCLPGEELGEVLVQTDHGEEGRDAALRLVTSLDATTLPIQGPPGSGKSTTGAEMILRLVDAGLKVGITANSHKVIGNLLEKALERSVRRGRPVRAVQKVSQGEQGLRHDLVTVHDKTPQVRAALDDGSAPIAAGTSWLWAAEQMREAVDVLFVDEAGQLSLANALAVSVGAGSMVLLGDPQQLDQPITGSHPEGAEVSALEHILGTDPVIDRRRGIFFEHTWRLHPQIKQFTSEIFYGGELESMPDLDRQQVHPAGEIGLHAADPFHGSGLRFVAVEHAGNSSRCAEEADVVDALARRLVDGNSTWTGPDGVRRVMTWEDLLIVAPYNAQVSAIRERLPADARRRVGTVDKFQGQEAAVSIYSMTTSSSDEAPHGMDFLYSLNRLNVATSRARCLAIVVANPALVRARCRWPHQVRLANALCRFIELAQPLTASPAGAAR